MSIRSNYQELSINTARVPGGATKNQVDMAGYKTTLIDTIKITITNVVGKNSTFTLFNNESPRLLAINSIILFTPEGKYKTASLADVYQLVDNQKITYTTANSDDNAIQIGSFFIITYTVNVNKKLKFLKFMNFNF